VRRLKYCSREGVILEKSEAPRVGSHVKLEFRAPLWFSGVKNIRLHLDWLMVKRPALLLPWAEAEYRKYFYVTAS
jgi:aromatic ring-cleaving dioxygenase